MKINYCLWYVGEGLDPPGDFGTKSHRLRRSVSVCLFPVGKSENDEAFFGGRGKPLPYNAKW